MSLIYCVIGVEFNIHNVPARISILGSFTRQEDAIKFRELQTKYTMVDIIESNLNEINENIDNVIEL